MDEVRGRYVPGERIALGTSARARHGIGVVDITVVGHAARVRLDVRSAALDVAKVTVEGEGTWSILCGGR